MFFKKSKSNILITLLGCVLSVDIALAEDATPSESTAAKPVKEEVQTKIIGRDASIDNHKSKSHIGDLEFHRSLNGGAVLEVGFEETLKVFAKYDTDLSTDGYTLTITFNDTSISDKWVSNINTKVFNTIVDSMRIYSEDNKVVIVVHSLDRIALTDSKDGDNIKFKIDRRTSRVTNFNVNEPITIAFKDAPVELVLQVLSEFAGLNLVISTSVRGNISIDLKNVPWNEVMNIVLISKGLATKKMNSIMYVATAAEIAAQEQLELQTKRSLENNAVLVTRFIPLNYTTAQAAQSVITSMAKMNGGVMSPRGSITSDTRTNTLIVTDTEEKIPLIKNVIDEIDIPSDQVLIEARIVESVRTSGFELGFNWGINGINMNTFNPGPQVDPLNPTTFLADTTVDVAWTMFGGMRVNLEVKAAESSALATEVASPHLVVANNETASIAQGKKVPYKQSTASGAGAISFQDAELKLEVTPQIAPDGYIVLELDITKNSVGPTESEDIPPQISTKSIVTKLMVKDGQTLVIGGIYDKVKQESKTKIPLLGDIPYLGYLFSYTIIADDDIELLIFITSTIIESRIE